MEAAIAELPQDFNTLNASAGVCDLSRCPELELAQRVAGGDMGALKEVYRRYHVIVYTLCLRMTRNVTEAEDLSQDVFVNLQRALGSFRGEAALSTWIHRVTVNRVLMHFRKAVVRYEQTTEDGRPSPRQAPPRLRGEPDSPAVGHNKKLMIHGHLTSHEDVQSRITDRHAFACPQFHTLNAALPCTSRARPTSCGGREG